MADSIWNDVEYFTIEQAACLWVGINPVSNDFRLPDHTKSEILAAIQMMAGAIISEELKADHSKNGLDIIGDYRKSIVTREELKSWAESKDRRPEFLFDTLLPFPDTERERRPGIERKRRPDIKRKRQVAEETTDTLKNKGGRPPEYDWNAFNFEIIRIADRDGLPETRADLVRQMQEWFSLRYDKEPAESLIRSRISLIYAGVQEAKGHHAKNHQA